MKIYELLVSQHRYAEAAVLLEQVIRETPENHNKSEIVKTLVNLGICYYETKRLEEARTTLEEALEIAQSDDKQGVSIVLHELSMVVSEQGDNSKAIEMCKKSVELQLERAEEPTVGLHTLSIIYQKARRWDEAMEILEMVRESCEARGDLMGLGKCLNEIGLTYEQKGDLVNAVKYLVNSIELKHRIGYKRGIETSMRNLSRCLQKQPLTSLDSEIERQLERLKDILK